VAKSLILAHIMLNFGLENRTGFISNILNRFKLINRKNYDIKIFNLLGIYFENKTGAYYCLYFSFYYYTLWLKLYLLSSPNLDVSFSNINIRSNRTYSDLLLLKFFFRDLWNFLIKIKLRVLLYYCYSQFLYFLKFTIDGIC